MESRRGATGRELLLHALLLVILLGFVFPATFLRGEVILPGGFLFETPPWKAYTPPGFTMPKNWLTIENLQQINKFHMLPQRYIDRGEWPLWNPLEFAGVPLHANFQSAVFYPPKLFFGVMDHYAAETLYILLKLWLCGFTAYLFGRYIGLNGFAARFFSAGWMLGTYNLIWCYWPEPDVGAWAPVVLLGIELLLDGRHRRGFFALAFGATLILLAGQPENAWSMSLGVGMYFFLRLAVERRWGKRLLAPVGLAAAAWGVAVLVCAVQILPFLEYMVNSHTYLNRINSEEGKHFLPTGAHLILWVARFFGTTGEETFWGKSNSTYLGMVYPGIAVWAGVFLLATRGGEKRQRVRTVCLLVPCALSLLMGFDCALVRPIQELPIMNAMWRCYFINFAKLSLPLLAAMGIQQWFSRPRRVWELAAPALCGLAVAAYVGGAFRFFAGLMRASHVYDYVAHQVAVAGVLGGAALAILLAYCFWPRPKVLASLLTVLLAFDLVWAVHGLLPTAPRSYFFPETQLSDYLEGLPKPCRISVVSAGTIRPSLVYPYDIEENWGHDGIYPERIITFYGALGAESRGSAIWNAMEPVCATPYYLHNPEKEFAFPHDEPGRFRLATTLDGIEVYENLRAFPRAFLAGGIEVIPSREALFKRMADPAYDPRRVVVTQQAPAGPLPQTAGAELGRADVRLHTASRVIVDVDASADCVLVLSDAHYPGWRARVDGQPVEIFPAYYAFRGLVVPAGKHEVEYLYQPLSFYGGLAVSTATLTLGLVLAVAVLVRSRLVANGRACGAGRKQAIAERTSSP